MAIPQHNPLKKKIKGKEGKKTARHIVAAKYGEEGHGS